MISYIPGALIVRMLIPRKVSDTNRKVDNRDQSNIASFSLPIYDMLVGRPPLLFCVA
jgi:hypothetical protein